MGGPCCTVVHLEPLNSFLSDYIRLVQKRRYSTQENFQVAVVPYTGLCWAGYSAPRTL